MNLTRKEDISLYLYLKDQVVGPNFMEVAEAEPLVSLGNNTWQFYDSTDKFPFKREEQSGLGRGLLYFDTLYETCLFGSEQQESVRIYTDLVTASGYQVNYLNGSVVSEQDLTGYTVDYNWNYVSVMDAWPYEDVPQLPIVSIQLQKAYPLPLQLGGGDIRNGLWSVQIFGSNKGERDDLMELLYENLHLRRCPLYALPSGLPLDARGFYNSSFSSELHTQYTSMFFERVEKKLTGLPSWGFYEQEIINRYRAEITFETKAYKN